MLGGSIAAGGGDGVPARVVRQSVAAMPAEVVEVGTRNLPTRFILLQLRELQPRCNCNRTDLHPSVSFTNSRKLMLVARPQRTIMAQTNGKEKHATKKKRGTQCTHHHSAPRGELVSSSEIRTLKCVQSVSQNNNKE